MMPSYRAANVQPRPSCWRIRHSRGGREISGGFLDQSQDFVDERRQQDDELAKVREQDWEMAHAEKAQHDSEESSRKVLLVNGVLGREMFDVVA